MSTDKSSEREMLESNPDWSCFAARMLALAEKWADNDIHRYQFAAEVEKERDKLVAAARAALPQQAQETSLPPQGAASVLPEQMRAFAKIHPGGDEVPGALRNAFFELFRQGWSAASDYYGIVVDGFGPPDARGYIDRIKQSDRASPAPAPQEPAMRIVARPLNWEQHGDKEWSDDQGFYISRDDDEDEPFYAAWGEGDGERFKTLDEAKAWCVRELEHWLNKCGHASPAPGALGAASAGCLEAPDKDHP